MIYYYIFIIIYSTIKKLNQALKKIDKEIGLRYDSYIMLNQIRAISKRRLIRRVATITDTNLFNNIIFDFEKKILKPS